MKFDDENFSGDSFIMRVGGEANLFTSLPNAVSSWCRYV